MSTINMYFVRHGQTYLNHYGRIQGWADSALTDKGVIQAIDTGKRLSNVNFNQAYSSDTKRATATAKLILKENPTKIKEPVQLMQLREENFGYFEGNDAGQAWHIIGGPVGANSYNEMISMFSMERTRDMIANADPYHDAENDIEFWKRVQSGLDYIVKNAPDNSNILAAAHGTLIRSLVSRFSDIDVSPSIKNGSVTKIVYRDGDYTVKSYNQG